MSMLIGTCTKFITSLQDPVSTELELVSITVVSVLIETGLTASLLF